MQIATTMLFCFVLLLCIPPSAGLYLCRHTNYTSSTFESNLNKILQSLVNNTSSSKGFNTSVSGRSPDRVYGLLQCWGDSTVAECFSCSQDAITSIRQHCGNVIGGKAWLDKCFIRYENFSFFGILDTEANVGYSSAKITVKPDVISTAVNGLFTNLSNEALRSPLRYSSGSTTTSTSYTISSMVQCWSDLTSVEDCRICLTNAISYLLDVTDNGTLQKAVAGSGSCVAQYERYAFFIHASPPPPPPPPPPPLQKLSPPSIRRPPSSSPTPSKMHINFLLS
ncbi:cysteine-rich repeat secretory protein 55-like [Cryptomeria japonica]|uniref:cysteine-rich repeat secretory protein 55-like n=1 Tax=Cryptomeria japonica TaxID=3369 RepID=UPI0025ACBBE9|nr:cysteine-rich repeat secretory protein 55-like [Cryptomeria japonica]